MSVRERALAAYEAAEAREAARLESEAQSQKRRERELADRALELVQLSVLAEWFPGTDWEVYLTREDDSVGRSWTGDPHAQLLAVVCADRPGGTDPEWAGVPCFGIGESEPDHEDGPQALVFYVHSRNDEGYTSWEGPRVRSLEQLGELIAAHEVAERKRLQARALEQCACARHRGGSLRVESGELRCMHVAEHRALLAAADAANCAMDVENAVRQWRRDHEQDEAGEGHPPRRHMTAQQFANHEAYAPGDNSLPLRRPEAARACPETGGTCQRNCGRDGTVVKCWARQLRLESEPEGRTTGVHRDSMG